MLVMPKQVEQWARRFELNLFTGRTRKEFTYTFERWAGTRHFRAVVTMDDVARKKPYPDGLLKILGGRDPGTALYVGDNVDDGLAAQAAGVRFMAILRARKHTSELQSPDHLVCRLLLEKKKNMTFVIAFSCG